MDNFEVFDEYRGNFLVGEMIWNFADFETDQCEQLNKLSALLGVLPLSPFYIFTS